MRDWARVLIEIDDKFSLAAEALHRQIARRVGRHWLKDKAQLAGRVCSCRRDLDMHLLHSEAVRESADVVIDFGSNVSPRGRRQVPPEIVCRVAGEISNADIVHVKADLLPEFVTNVLPSIRGTFVLVTGDSDYSPVLRFRNLLEDPRVVHWFAQNCDLPELHPKLTRLPIGLDNPRYTKLEKRVGFLAEMLLRKTAWERTLSRNDIGDQKLLQDIAKTLEQDVRLKPLKALCTFHMNQKVAPNFADIPDRLAAFHQLRHNEACFFVPKRLVQKECWELHGQFAFEVSPRGKGLDCFRTWEGLFLSTIPIVKTSALDALYAAEGFPVVVVSSYEEVTPANLARWRDELAPRFTPALRQKLTSEFWIDRIKRVQAGERSRIEEIRTVNRSA